MTRKIFFYSLLFPFLLSLTILFTPLLNLFPLNPPEFIDAVNFCDSVINDDVYASEYGTMQDSCIAKFMGEPHLFKNLIILFSFLGIFFIVPIFLYLIRNLKAYI